MHLGFPSVWEVMKICWGRMAVMCSTLCIFLNVLEPDGLYPFYSFKVSVFIYPYISLPNVSWELAVVKPGSQCLVCRTVVLKITQWFSLVGPEAQCGWGTGPRSRHIRQKAKVKQNLWGHGAKVFTAVPWRQSTHTVNCGRTREASISWEPLHLSSTKYPHKPSYWLLLCLPILQEGCDRVPYGGVRGSDGLKPWDSKER